MIRIHQDRITTPKNIAKLKICRLSEPKCKTIMKAALTHAHLTAKVTNLIQVQGRAIWEARVSSKTKSKLVSTKQAIKLATTLQILSSETYHLKRNNPHTLQTFQNCPLKRLTIWVRAPRNPTRIIITSIRIISPQISWTTVESIVTGRTLLEITTPIDGRSSTNSCSMSMKATEGKLKTKSYLYLWWLKSCTWCRISSEMLNMTSMLKIMRSKYWQTNITSCERIIRTWDSKYWLIVRWRKKLQKPRRIKTLKDRTLFKQSQWIWFERIRSWKKL